MPPEDRIRVLHMLEAAEAVAAFIACRERPVLDADRMLLFALVHACFDIDRDILWKTAVEEIPSLCPLLKGMIDG
jgi:uncharacterized protein with HEPN domain